MRLLVISDVHADANALDSVLAHASERGWDQALVLGDVVGYGEDAGRALERLRTLPMRAAVVGNHEAMLDELRKGRRPNAARSIIETLRRNLRELSERDLEFLDAMQNEFLDESWGAVHGALRSRFEYLISVPVARSNVSHMKRDLYFVGHTHVPAAYVREQDGTWRARSFTAREGRLRVPQGARAFLNPGAVSLPRDRIPGSCYGIFDEEEREFAVYRLS